MLVQAALKEDLEAYREIMSRYERLVASIVYKMTFHTQDREDLCQDIFLKVFEKLRSFRSDSKLSTWIGSIAYHHCLNFLSKKKHLLLDDLNNSGDGSGDTVQAAEMLKHDAPVMPDEVLWRKDMKQLLEKGMQKLNPVQRTILNLFHQHDFSLDDIADMMKLPVNTISSHSFRARNILRGEMQKALKHD